MRASVAIAGAVALLLFVVGFATAQPLRLTFRREADEPSSIVLRGELHNDGPRDVVDVWVGAEATNDQAAIVSRGLAYVTSFLAARGTTAFTVKLPRVEAARSFRVAVSSFRYASGSEAP